MRLQVGPHLFTWPRPPLLMGILNLGADSFSGDGLPHLDTALARARALVAEGADLVDVGVVSARPGTPLISEPEEIDRLSAFQARWHAGEGAVCPLAINTWRPAVVRAVLAQGCDLLNDLGGLPTPENAEACARTGAALLIMHTVGQPKVPHRHVVYADVLTAVDDFFTAKLALAESAGLPRERILLDPGLDFAKQCADNLRLLRHAGRWAHHGRPVLLPISRKHFIGEVLHLPEPAARDAGTIACLVQGYLAGGQVFRVHAVRAARQALAVLGALSEWPSTPSPSTLPHSFTT